MEIAYNVTHGHDIVYTVIVVKHRLLVSDMGLKLALLGMIWSCFVNWRY